MNLHSLKSKLRHKDSPPISQHLQHGHTKNNVAFLVMALCQQTVSKYFGGTLIISATAFFSALDYQLNTFLEANSVGHCMKQLESLEVQASCSKTRALAIETDIGLHRVVTGLINCHFIQQKMVRCQISEQGIIQIKLLFHKHSFGNIVAINVKGAN